MLRFFSIAALAMIMGASAAAFGQSPEHTSLTNDELLDFRYSFPTVVGSYPELLSKIEADRSASQAEALDGARRDAEIRAEDPSYDFHPHDFWRDWMVTGQTGRLIALRSHTEWFSGGAHGNRNSGLMMWDKEQKAALSFDALFVDGAAYWSVMKGDYCKELIAERMRRVSESIADCSSPKDLVLVPVDTNSDWAFDSIHVIADPYVAGAYVEGTYEIAFPVNAAFISHLKPEYRSSFEAQPQ
jgi:hypothetical protein